MKKLLSCFLFLISFANLAFAACDPPTPWAADTDWTINANENCANASIQINITGNLVVNGNLSLYSTLLWVNKSLTVNANGNLSLSNTTLRMNNTVNYGSQIVVKAYGLMNVTNSSHVTNGIANVGYGWTYYGYSKGLVNGTLIERIYGTGTGFSGLVLVSSGVGLPNQDFDNVSIENNTIRNTFSTCMQIEGAGNVTVFNNSMTCLSYGMYLYGLINGNISNNYIYVSGGGQSALVDDAGSYNTIADNTLLGGTNEDAFYLTASYENITNNTMIYAGIGYGLEFAGGAYNRIQNNTIVRMYTTTTFLNNNIFADNWIYNVHYDTGYNQTYCNNTFTSAVGQAYIVNFDRVGSQNITFYNNSLTGALGTNVGIGITGDYNKIENNTFDGRITYIASIGGNNNRFYNNSWRTTYTEWGFYLLGADNNVFINNTVNGTITAGFNFNQSSNNIIDNNSINNNSIGIMFSWFTTYSGTEINNILANNSIIGNNITLSFNNTNAILFNVTLPSANIWNATLGQNSQINFINVSFTESAINISDTSELTVRWYVGIRTVKQDYTPYPYAMVEVKNTTGHRVVYDMTDANGYMIQPLVEYQQYATLNNTWNPQTFTATYQAENGSNTTNVIGNDVGSVYIVLSGSTGGGGGSWNPPPEKGNITNKTRPPEPDEDETKCMQENNIISTTQDSDKNGISDWIEICGTKTSERAGGGGAGFNNPVYYIQGIQIIPDKLFWENVKSGTNGGTQKVNIIFAGEHTIDFKSDTSWALLPKGETFTDQTEVYFDCDASWLKKGDYYDIVQVYTDGVLAAELPIACGVEGTLNIWWKLGIDQNIALALLFIIIIALLYELRRRSKRR